MPNATLADNYLSRPQVILTSVCPGPVKTELSRSMQENSIIAKIAAPLFMSLVGKSPDYGARIYITGALAGPKDHVSYQTARGVCPSGRLDLWKKAITSNPIADIAFGHRGSSCAITSQTHSTPAGPPTCWRARRHG